MDAENKPGGGAKQPRGWSDTDIVTALRGDDHERRVQALDALFPMNQGVFLIRCDPKFNQTTASARLNAPRMFTLLIDLCMRIGKLLGLRLEWTQPPPEDESDKIQIAQPGAFR